MSPTTYTTSEKPTVYTTGNGIDENSTTDMGITSTTIMNKTSIEAMSELYITIGAVFGAAVATIIGAITILCIVISMKKHRQRKASVDLTNSKKNPNRDGYINALYDSK